MKFYHGTKNKELRELTLDHYKNEKEFKGCIYVTDSYEMAVFYAGCSLRTWRYDKANDMLIINEIAAGALKKMYKNSTCYIFTCECDERDLEKDEGNSSGHTYVSRKNIKLNPNCETIPDAYSKILELEKEGRIKISWWKDKTEEEKRRTHDNTVKAWKPVMKLEKENFFEEYQLMIKIFPELKIED